MDSGWRRGSRRIGASLITCLLWMLLPLQSTVAQATPEQPPATDELPEVFEGPGVRPSGFLLVDENGEKIFIPPMTFEQLDRLSDVEAGVVQPTKPYAFESIDVRGAVESDRAELDIAMRLNLAAPNGRWFAVPLQLSGFHPQRPFDVEGVENYFVDYSQALGGNILWVKADQPRTVEIRVGTVARVSTESGRGLDFKLPKASTSMELSLLGDDLDARVVGSGDEVVETLPGESGRTAVRVECNGGEFSLRWRTRDGSRPNEQVLEVDTRTRISWDDPSLPVSVVVDVDVNNRRGSLTPFDLQLPPEAQINEPLDSSGGMQLAIKDARAGLVQVTPEESEQAGRSNFSVEYRLPAGNYDAENPLRLSPLSFPAAVRHRGEIEIRTERSQRLRWRQSSAMRTNWQLDSGEGPETRVYLFQFDRASFELPIWLTTKQQPLRLTQSYAVSVAPSAASLEATISASGPLLEGLPLVIDTVGWETVEVVDAGTDRALESPFGEDGNRLEIELGELTASPGGTVAVRWKAARSVAAESENPVIEFPVPRIDSLQRQAVIVAPALVSLRTAPGLALIPDLAGTENLLPLPRDNGDPLVQEHARYRVDMVVEPARFRGFLTESPAEAQVQVMVEMAADDSSLRIRNRWEVTPRGNLRGQLPIEGISRSGGIVVLPAAAEEAAAEGDDAGSQAGDDAAVTIPARGFTGVSDWEVTVDGEPAVLRFDPQRGARAGVIYSERINGQPLEIQLTGTIGLEPQATPSASDPTAELKLQLPRPAINGDEIRGETALRLIEAPGWRLQLTSPSAGASEPLDLRRSAFVNVTIEPRRVETASAVRFEQALVRSEIARRRRYDRVLLRVRGDASRLSIPMSLPALSATGPGGAGGAAVRTVRVLVNDQLVPEARLAGRELVVPLPLGEGEYLVDARIWSPREGFAAATRLRPPIDLPLDSGKAYWDVVLPADRHLIWNRTGSGQLMAWRFDRLFLSREPVRSHAELVQQFGGEATGSGEQGNRYLLVSADLSMLQLVEAGRPILWLAVSGTVFVLAMLLVYLPVLRHPLLAVLLGCLLAGIAWIAPDLAVLAGQLMLAALVIVAVMLGTRAMLRRRPRATVLGNLGEGSSIRSRPLGESRPVEPEPRTTQVQNAVASGSAAGVQS